MLGDCAGDDGHLAVVILGTRMRISGSQEAMMETAAPQEEVVVEGTGVQMVKRQGTILETLLVPSGSGGLCVFAVSYRYAVMLVPFPMS